MENLDEDLTELQNNSSGLEMEQVVAQASAAALSLNNSHNDSVQIIETPIEVLDLTSPQPSTSSSTSSSSAGAATALVGATSLVKRNLEEALKEERNTTDSSAQLDQNPSTSNSSAATTSSSNTNTGNVLECPICLQTCIHPARLPCGHIFCFLCVKGVAYKNRRCAMCRREIPPEFLDHPQLVNGIEDICTTKATDDGYQWFYEGRNGGWWAYEKRNASEIEEAFQYLFNKRINNRLPHKKMEKVGIKTEQDVKDDEDINIEVEVDEQDFDSEDDDDDDDDGEGVANDNKNKVLKPLTYDIQICGTMYTVDFQNMVQYPQAMPYRKRKICRAKGLPAKGVAGLKAFKRNRRNKPY